MYANMGNYLPSRKGGAGCRVLPKRVKGARGGLKGLTEREMQVLSLWLTGGYEVGEIAELAKVSVATIYAIVGKPICQQVIEDFRKGGIGELEALLPKVIHTVREGLDDSKPGVRMAAVDKFIKMSKQVGEEKAPVVEITVIEAREKFVRKLKDITPKKVEIDG